MNKHQQASLATRRKLVTAALEIFKEKGFGTVVVEDITRAAGVAKGTFYSHFKRKEDIVIEICREPFRCACEEAVQSEDDILSTLARYYRRFLECIEIYDMNVCRAWVRDVIDPNGAPEDRDNHKWDYDVRSLRSIFQNAVDRRELRPDTPVELLTHLLVSQLYGMMTCWCMSDGRFKPQEWAERFCAVQMPSILIPYLISGKP